MSDTRPFDDTEAVPGFVNADEVPLHLLDPPPTDEGDDTVHAPGQEHRRQLVVKAPAFPVKSRARIVPFHRTIRFGSRGSDVIAVKRALSHAGYMKWPTDATWSRNYGPILRSAVHRFQKRYGLKQGAYEINTHRKLVSLGHFDKWGAHLMAISPRPRGQDQSHRDKIVATMLWAYHHRDQIHYAQSRPIDGHGHPYKLPLSTDCSGISTDAYEWSGAHDPNGFGFNGEGWTGTLAKHGIQTFTIKGGDLNFYGNGYPYHHVTVALGATTCGSHGSEGGPYLLPIRYRTDYDHTRTYNP